MNAIPAVIDVARLIVGICFVAVTFFMMGLYIGRRLSYSPTEDFLRRHKVNLHGHMSVVHRRLERLINAAFTAMEELMVSQTQRLIDEMHTVETKLDGYVSIINTSNETFGQMLDMLKNSDAPPQELVDAAITGVETHLTSVGDALAKLAARSLPVAPAPQQPVPTPDPVAVPVQGTADPGTPQTPA